MLTEEIVKEKINKRIIKELTSTKEFQRKYIEMSSITSNHGKSPEERKIATAMLFSSPFELNRIINELDRQLIENFPPLPEVNTIVKNSSLYEMILLSEDVLSLLNSPNSEKYVTPYIEYGFTKERMIKRIRGALKIAYNKLGKIIVKYKQDFLMESTAHNIYSPIHYLFE